VVDKLDHGSLLLRLVSHPQHRAVVVPCRSPISANFASTSLVTILPIGLGADTVVQRLEVRGLSGRTQVLSRMSDIQILKIGERQ
jgi:hypothetical protein